MKFLSYFDFDKNLKKKRFFFTAVRISFALLSAFFICQIKLDFIESTLYDLRTRLHPTHSTNEIELVYITPDTIKNLKGYPNARVHGEILARINSVSPLAVVYDFALDQVAGDDEAKKLWAKSIEANPSVFGPTKDVSMEGEAVEKLPPPLDHLKLISAPKSTDSMNFAKDGVTRRLLLNYQGHKLLQLVVASLANAQVKDVNNIRGRFNFIDTDQIFINFNPPNFYPRTQLTDILKEGFNLERFRNKIVLIGTDLGLTPEEYAATPHDRNPSGMTRLEVQANAIDTLIQNSAPVRTPDWLNWLLTSLVSILTVYVVLSLKPLRGLAVLGVTFGAVCLVGYLAFWPFGLWIDMAHPLLAIFLCYYFFIPYRLIIENRRSWEYYQKNRLLKQVEELKGNFISMMSHDLKTPIARIQGMTDVILADAVTLSSQQREAVDTIRHSSDDLLKFINTILNYGRIESEGVHLQLQSKDINSLLAEVIRKNEFHAKVKHIQIVQELEPLFAIQVDPDLIRQVLSNLLENAIKYSPEHTKILITTEERDDKIVVQVSDQGEGIPADELSNIFMKFFRSKHAKSSPIKGSGLGLYLAKYFIELHRGTVFVESSYGQGSTFTVELPIKQGKNHA